MTHRFQLKRTTKPSNSLYWWSVCSKAFLAKSAVIRRCSHTLPCAFLRAYDGGMRWLPIFFLFLFSAQTGAFDEGDLKKLKATNACVKCDLSGTNLSGENLKGANLDGANLQEANLEGANLEWAYLHGANLKGANLERANLGWAVLFDANLTGAILREADLWEAYLKVANLSRANLTRANLTDADLTNAIMMKAIVQGAIFCRTIMPDETLNNSGC